jgi:hypothetical protein
MASGPGKYDGECTAARLATKGKAVMLIVLDGHSGHGHETQLVAATRWEARETLEALREHLRVVIAQLEGDITQLGGN